MFRFADAPAGSGPRDNLTFEGIALTPDARFVWCCMENSLQQDGPMPGVDAPGGPCPGQYWHPENLVTRAQTAKLVTLAAGYSDPIAPTKQTFREVPPTHPYWVFVERAVAHGLVSGYDCDNVTYNVCGATFENCPGTYYRCCQPITRSQAAKYIALAFYPTCNAPANRRLDAGR